ncbi:MAG: alpha/beta hydrolase [bacterium]|nr:alpha/beta hydrolase [bacterium]
MTVSTKSNLPRLEWLHIPWNGRHVALPCYWRPGRGGASVLFVHGLGGARENFSAAFQSRGLADCTLVTFDLPGTGLAHFDPEWGLDVTALADITHTVAEHILPGPYYLAGASMGGLINLLQIRRHGLGRIQGVVSLEGQLAPEDCMFSRRVVPHDLASFTTTVFPDMAAELAASTSVGDRLIAQAMEVNVDARAYHAYSFETVAESDSEQLLPQFLSINAPTLFLYGDANRQLSYLPTLRGGSTAIAEIAGSGHFLFYDNPHATFATIGEFIHEPN